MKTLLRSTVLALAAMTLVGASTMITATAEAANNDVRVRARLSGNTPASGKADYRERTKKNTLEQRFSVQIEGAAPGAIMPVLVNGAQVGLIFIDDFGLGEIQFRTEVFIDDPGDGTPIPTDFPRLAVGDTVQVGDALFGTF
jgi:hypothetical protein